MAHPPVVAYHLIITRFGFWLPNDPRGSNSTHVWAQVLKQFGPATKVNVRRSVAHVPHDRQARFAAKRGLKHPPIRFSGHQAQCVAKGFKEALHREHVTCLACSILPDHSHLVVTRPSTPIEEFAVKLKTQSVHSLLDASLHPYQQIEANRPKIRARGDRHVYLSTDEDIDG